MAPPHVVMLVCAAVNTCDALDIGWSPPITIHNTVCNDPIILAAQHCCWTLQQTRAYNVQTPVGLCSNIRCSCSVFSSNQAPYH
jgi:hypothetical protein